MPIPPDNQNPPQQGPKLLTNESYKSHLKLLNLPEEFVNTVEYFRTTAISAQQQSSLLIQVIANHLRQSDVKSMKLTTEDYEELSKAGINLDIIIEDDFTEVKLLTKEESDSERIKNSLKV